MEDIYLESHCPQEKTKEDTIQLRFVNSIGAELLIDNIDPSETVLELKSRLSQVKLLDPKHQMLFYYLERLENDRKLKDYKIQNKSTLLYAFDFSLRFADPEKRMYWSSQSILKQLFGMEDFFEADQILDKLWLGNINAAFHYKFLQENGITHVLTVHQDLKPMYPELFTYMVIQVEDFDNSKVIHHFEDAINFIDLGRTNGSILVHCTAGRSRSVTMVIAYLMKTRNENFQDSLDFVVKRRSVASPNSGFRQQLQIFGDMECSLANETQRQRDQLADFTRTARLLKT